MALEESIKKYALQNAIHFNGKCNPGSVIGKIISEYPEVKKNMKKTMQLINDTCKEISSQTLKTSTEQLKAIDPSLLEKKKGEKKEGLKDLKNAKENEVVVRIAPSPSGPLHIGHAYGASLNYEYAKKYKGKFIVRIEDTNPNNIYPQGYELIEEDTKWLTENHVDKLIIQSSRLDIYYEYAKKLVDIGKAYVCNCNSDEWRENKNNKIACKCRNLEIKEQQLRFYKLFKEYSDGEAILRLKTNIKDKNPAMRDFGIMRINEQIHPKTGKKNRVWPLMVLSVAIDDHLLGITHVMNGKEHADNAKKEAMIMELLGWTPPEYLHWGRINFEGFSVSASKTKLAIEQNNYEGWDDIRLPFLPALRKKGYQPKAFRKFAIQIGLSLNDKTVSMEEFWKNINFLNKEIIEPTSNRFFFINDPIEIEIENAPTKEFELDLHPDKVSGGRLFSTNTKFIITKNDFELIKENEEFRLMDCLNFNMKNNKFLFTSEDYKNFKGKKIIHWLPKDENFKVEILMNDNKWIKGFGENNLKYIKIGDIIQFERFGFCKLQSIENNIYKFWFTHK